MYLKTNLLALLVNAWMLIARVSSYNLTMIPEYTRASKDSQTVTFTCSADAALVGCQFVWWDYTHKTGPLLDLSQGPLSQANSSLLTSEVTGYSYSGRGLGVGDCGASLQVQGGKIWMIACRVRSENGDWTYAWVDFYNFVNGLLPHTVTSREAVVLPGGDARFSLKAQEPLSMCHCHLVGYSMIFNGEVKSSPSTDRHRYLGAGLEQGECGVALSNVNEKDNGPIRCWMLSPTHSHDANRYMALIVTRPPTAPTLSVAYTDAGVTATCVVHEARPVANITWVFGDVVIRQDSQVDSTGNPEDAWRWPWTAGSVLQRLTLSRQTKDNGKILKCVASHVALAQPLEATETISYNVSDPVSGASPLVTTSTTPSAAHNTTCGSSPTLDPTGSIASMLGRVCKEYRALDNTACPRDEVYELRVRESLAAARTAELAEEQGKITLEAAKAESVSNATLATVALETAVSMAKAEETKAMLAQVALEAAKAEAAYNATLAKLAEEQATVALEAAKAEAASNATLAMVTLELANSSARIEVARARKAEAEAAIAEHEVEGAGWRAKADDAWRINAEEELQYERARRLQSLLQLQNGQG